MVCVGIIWGTIGVAAKLIDRHTDLDPVTVTWLRAAIASPIYLFLAWRALGRQIFASTSRDRTFMIGLGVVLILYQWWYLEGVVRLGVSAATLITLCVPPVIVALASTVLFRERLTARTLISLFAALGGIVLLIGWQSPQTDTRGSMAAGIIFSVGSATGIACHVLGSRVIGGRHHALRPLSIAFVTGVVVFFPMALRHDLTFDIPVVGWLLLFYLAIVPSVIGYWLYQRGLQDVSAMTASIVTLLEPLTAAVIAWILFDERLGMLGWIGGGLLIAAITLLSIVPAAAKKEPVADLASV
jgi:DME family drug/metabolite transporter